MINLAHAIGPYDDYCNGYGSLPASGDGYFIAFVLGVGRAKLELHHEGSYLLDSINAFDRAEVADSAIGQINMITVSSFCGPKGVIWGYHTTRAASLYTPHPVFPQAIVYDDNREIPVYSALPLIDAARALFGSVTHKRFPLFPGSHVPCAKKSITMRGPKHIYCCLAIGIAQYPEKDATLLMEDVGELPVYVSGTNEEKTYRTAILKNTAQSIVAIGKNQHVVYKEIFVGMKDVVVRSGEVGCVLAAVPYFTLARKAIPTGNIQRLRNISLDEWIRATGGGGA